MIGSQLRPAGHCRHSRVSRYSGIGISVLAIMTPTLAAAQDAIRQTPEVVVSASRIPLPSREVGSAVTVITAEEIKRKQVRIVSGILREVPGVAVNRSGPAGSFTQIRIRGAEGNQTLVIIDGVEINDPSGGSEFDFGKMHAVDIERIEVLRGPQSALYGSDAIGGVINIITKKGDGPATAQLNTERGSFGTRNFAANANGSGERYRFSLGAAKYSTDGVSIAPESEGNAESDGHRNHTYNARIGLTPFENLDVDFVGRYSKSLTDTDRQPSVAGIIKTVDSDSETKTIQRTGRAQVKYSMLDGAWEHLLGAGVNEENAESFRDGASTFKGDGKTTKFDYQTNVFFGTPSFADGEHTLTFLAEQENESQFTSSAFGRSDLDVTNNGYVGEYRVGLWDRLFLSGSTRRDNNELFEDASTYRAAAAWLYGETGTRLHGSYGTGVKNPTLSELFGFGPNFVPNPNLQPETSKGWDAGIEQSFFGDRGSIDVTYFNNRITDLIQGSGNTAVNLNGTSKIDGIEVSAKATFGEGITLSGQYTYTNGQDASHTELVRRPKHLASLNLHQTFLEGRAGVNLGIDYNGERRDTQFSNFFGTRTAVTLDDYVLVNAAGSYEFSEGVELFGRIENLLDEDYQDVLGFSNPGIGVFVGIRTSLDLF